MDSNGIVKPGFTKLMSIALKGNVSMGLGDYVMASDGRCGVGTIEVPNPCNNKCNFGQWTDWKHGKDSQCDKPWLVFLFLFVCVMDSFSNLQKKNNK